MFVADTLSRAQLREDTPEIPDDEINSQIHIIITALPISENKLKLFKEETDKDPVLNIVKTYVLQGRRDKGDPATIQFAAIKDEISYHHGLLLRGSRIIVPSSLGEEIKNTIHQGHLGMEKSKLRARSTVNWPDIN